MLAQVWALSDSSRQGYLEEKSFGKARIAVAVHYSRTMLFYPRSPVLHGITIHRVVFRTLY